MRRLTLALSLSLVVTAMWVTLAGAGGMAGAAPVRPAQEPASLPAGNPVEVVKVSGLLDEVLVSFVEDRIAVANEEQLTALVLQVNSAGAVVSDDRIVELARQMRASKVPVAVWVGPAGAKATGAAAQLVAIATPGGVTAGAAIGRAGPQILPEAEFGTLWAGQAEQLEAALVRSSEDTEPQLRDLELVYTETLGDFVINLEGVAVRQVGEGAEARREPVTPTRLTALSFGRQLLHTVASPPVAYLLFAIGLGLLVFELFTAGVGVAGLVGAGCVALGCYGLGALPVRGWAVALLVAAFVAFAIDVQTGVPRFWTAVGFLCFVVATFSLVRSGVGMSWITKGVGLVGVLLTYLSGMPSMVRTRFSTTTIGREWMVGELGLALSDVAPDGTVSVRSARWPARTNRATPITAGDRIRVTGIEGVVLEVEPEEGGAKDYRERARSRD
jgi:membrane-bound serine protease (ClpP class)